ncbi:MAG: hypothetical protein JOZ19_14365 [Rubrobacter sp.]|nr:hypothetical protein [Rubrobacter sp.]
MKEIVREALIGVERDGLDTLGNFPGHPGELSMTRAQDIAAAINRVRSLEATTESRSQWEPQGYDQTSAR